MVNTMVLVSQRYLKYLGWKAHISLERYHLAENTTAVVGAVVEIVIMMGMGNFRWWQWLW